MPAKSLPAASLSPANRLPARRVMWQAYNSLICLILLSIGPAIFGREAMFVPALREAAGPAAPLTAAIRAPPGRLSIASTGVQLALLFGSTWFVNSPVFLTSVMRQ